MQSRSQTNDRTFHTHVPGLGHDVGHGVGPGLGFGPTGELFDERSDHDTWQGPTLPELADRVEHQFGELPALAGLHSLGFARDEPLEPCDIHLVCDLLGLPAADFGLDV